MAEKNHLGLDKYQITIIKSNHAGTKPIRKLIEKAENKIKVAEEKRNAAIKAAQDKYEESVKELVAEAQAYKDQIAVLDKFTLETTKQACGLELTSQQVMDFIENPAAFEDYKHQLGLDNDLFKGKDDKGDNFPDNLPEKPESEE